ncbi:hypothetical protein [Arenibacter lacus]|uniref:hypothetical protein n=1 Tax=Arenibacter lacus TaxID=2608629 RepID=UPI00123DA127|nr:hypothetical protein [Arenibacter lacus]
MNTKLRKLAKLAAAGLFLVALVINVKVTLDEPFRLVSDRALAQAGGTTGELESCWVRTEVSCRMKNRFI